MNEKQLEKQKLKETLEIIHETLNEEKQELKDLYNTFIGNRDELWKVAEHKKIHISNLETSLDKPYFARIDFTYDDGETHTIYIGKNGVSQKTNIVITDWRAPISSLYYDAEVGECSFEAPDRTISGIMNLKRQYEIEKGELIDYFDVDLVSNDELLQKYLNSNNDARLKSIVSTIQKEQNDVIRKKMIDNLIIQGVAGSGKTTVALHRIAYLVYNYMKYVQQNQYLVIGPNPIFIKYIKSVLPDLDVSGVKQCIFEQFAQSYINEEININSSDKKVNDSINGCINNDIDKFKCSIKYKNMLDKFLNLYFYGLTSDDLKMGNFVIIKKEHIKDIFESTKDAYHSSLDSRIEQTIEKIGQIIENNNETIMSKYNDYSFEIFQLANSEEEKTKLRKKILKEREEIRKNCRSTLRKYFSKSKVSATKPYKLFVSTLNGLDIYKYEHLNILKKDTLLNIKKGVYDFEDLAALMYIKYVISPNKDYNKIRHVVIDEAQDLGEFNFFVMKKVLPSATFSIFGDLAQSIYDYRGINNWQEVNDIMFENKGKVINFNKSYRTTAEIMNVADEIAQSIGLGCSELVVRHGKEVDFTHAESKEKIPDYIMNKIKKYKEKGYKTIAVISKTNLLSNYINDDLSDRGMILPNISIDDDLVDEKFRICTISNQLAKGLEFDAVIINNASEEIYSSSNTLDMKLLYVAITRALHELNIVYTDELSKPLHNFKIRKLVK